MTDEVARPGHAAEQSPEQQGAFDLLHPPQRELKIGRAHV